MGPALLVALFTLVTAAQPALAAPRHPSCEVLLAFSFGMGAHVVERSFGMRVDDMSQDDFNSVLDVVQDCIDTITAEPADVPGLTLRERKTTQISVLSVLAEEIRFHRTRARERERDRRAVK